MEMQSSQNSLTSSFDKDQSWRVTAPTYDPLFFNSALTGRKERGGHFIFWSLQRLSSTGSSITSFLIMGYHSGATCCVRHVRTPWTEKAATVTARRANLEISLNTRAASVDWWYQSRCPRARLHLMCSRRTVWCSFVPGTMLRSLLT